jgi:hypothetical protein
LWPPASQAVGKICGEFHDDTALIQDRLDIAKAEAEHLVRPDSVADDLGNGSAIGGSSA